ncbi:hypothetical protein BC830DRAFT_1232633 [Chytriomyces sp. MP71]|nr:hypothetical protein BC830DRAFT_1232633 [Chytriomyces sp. MP71]
MRLTSLIEVAALMLLAASPIAAGSIQRRDPLNPGHIAMNMVYQGGRIVAIPAVTPVFIGSVSPSVRANMIDFYKHIWFTEWTTVLSQYSVLNDTNFLYGITGAGYVANVLDFRSMNAITVDDVSTLQPLLHSLVKNKSIHVDVTTFPGLTNAYVPIYFAPNVTITSGSASCRDWCALHSAIDISDIYGQPPQTSFLYYSLHPDLSNTGCAGQCGSLDTIGNMQMAASHELAEVMTNPDVAFLDQGDGEGGQAWSWADTRPYIDGSEISDICDLRPGKTRGWNGKTYAVSLLYSRLSNSCEDHLTWSQKLNVSEMMLEYMANATNLHF